MPCSSQIGLCFSIFISICSPFKQECPKSFITIHYLSIPFKTERIVSTVIFLDTFITYALCIPTRTELLNGGCDWSSTVDSRGDLELEVTGGITNVFGHIHVVCEITAACTGYCICPFVIINPITLFLQLCLGLGEEYIVRKVGSQCPCAIVVFHVYGNRKCDIMSILCLSRDFNIHFIFRRNRQLVSHGCSHRPYRISDRGGECAVNTGSIGEHHFYRCPCRQCLRQHHKGAFRTGNFRTGGFVSGH